MEFNDRPLGPPRLAAAVAVMAGVMVLAGWALDIAALKSILPGWVSVKPNAAVCFILMGVALLFSSRRPSVLNSGLARLGGLLAGLVGLLTLIEYVCGWNPGFDQWLFPEPVGTVGTSSPGRMAPDTALCFLLLAAGLEIARVAPKRKQLLFAPAILGALVTAAALAAILTYLTPGLGPFGWWGLTNMAVPTAVVFGVLGAALVWDGWRKSVSHWSLGSRNTLAFGVGLMLVVCLGLYTSRSVVRLANNVRRIGYAEHVMHHTVEVLAAAAKAQTHARGYLITGDERYLRSERAAAAQCRAALAELRQVIIDPAQRTRSVRLEVQVNEILPWFSQMIAAHQAGVAVAVQRGMVDHGEDLMDRLRATIEEMMSEESWSLQTHQRASERVSRITHGVIITGTVAGLIVLLSALLGVNRAVTERHRAARALRREQMLVHALMENLPDYIYFKDTASRFLRVNPALARLFGVTDPAQVVGKMDADFLPAERARTALADEREIVRTGVPLVDVEEKTVHFDGSESWVLTTKLPLRDGAGRIIGTCGISSDITVRKQTEAALQRSARELQGKNAELERFLYTASHDLKSPVVTVKTFLGFLEQDLAAADGARIKKDVDFIRGATDKMGQLLDDLLEMSRIGRVVNPPVRILLRSVVDDALGAVAGRIAARGVTVARSEGEVVLQGDRQRLAEIWQNLVDNACKFMGDQRAPRLEIGVEARGAETVFFVRDNGIGIDPHYHAKVFELFEKLDPRVEGTGIGLAIVKRIVELYRGRIWVESLAAGPGSCFCFTLPGAIQKPDEGVAQIVGQSPRLPSLPVAAGGAPA